MAVSFIAEGKCSTWRKPRCKLLTTVSCNVVSSTPLTWWE